MSAASLAGGKIDRGLRQSRGILRLLELKHPVWISVPLIRCSQNANGSFSGRHRGRARAQRRDRSIARTEKAALVSSSSTVEPAGGRNAANNRPLRAGVSVVTTGDHIGTKKISSNFSISTASTPPVELSARLAADQSCSKRRKANRCGQRPSANIHAADSGEPLPAGGERKCAKTTNIIVDVHGETTNEKIAAAGF